MTDLIQRLRRWANFGYGFNASKCMHEACAALEASDTAMSQANAALEAANARIADLEAQLVKANDAWLALSSMNSPECQACGDGITTHDPGVCGNCFAMKYRDRPTKT